jgi:hypothetical protein
MRTRKCDTAKHLALARHERIKFFCLAGAIIIIWGIIFTSLAYGTNVTGVTTTAVTGNFVVGGEVYYKSAVGGLPSGAILMFTTACPTGWTRQTVFDGRYVRIATTVNLTGGTSTHTPTFTHDHDSAFGTQSGGSNHQHGGSGGLGAVGDHLHTGSNDDANDGGGYGFWQQGYTTSSNGGHSHSFTYSTGFTDAGHGHTSSGTSGSGGPTVDAANNDPTRISAVLCKKN